jgi:hypothetical protein
MRLVVLWKVKALAHLLRGITKYTFAKALDVALSEVKEHAKPYIFLEKIFYLFINNLFQKKCIKFSFK